MSDLRANTDIMRSGAASIADSGNTVAQSVGKISSLSNNIGNAYDGQLREKLVPILSGASSEGTRLQSHSLEISGKLASKASEIDAVMQMNSNMVVFSTATTIGSPLRAFFARILGLSIITSILGFIGIKTDKPLYTNITQKIIPTPPPSTTSTDRTDYQGFSSKVPGDVNRRTLSENSMPDKNSDAVALYPRGNGSHSSNCTWYAASAVETAYGVPLNSGEYGETGTFKSSLGMGAQWAERAQAATNDPNSEYNKYISSVDQYPEPGTVYSTPATTTNKYGHVMFVEEANLVEVNGSKSWEIVVSEENWFGTPISKDAIEVEISGHPEVKRWTRKITIPADTSGKAETKGSFIHFISQK
jgi:surface antigen